DSSGARADEGQKLRFAGKAAGFLAELFGQWIRRIEPASRLSFQSAAFRLRIGFLRDTAGAAGLLPSARDEFEPRAFCAPAFRVRRAGRFEAALPALASINATA